MTPRSLFDYVIQFTATAVSADSDQLYPTYRQVSAKFHVNFNDIEQACHDWDQSQGYMGTAVGLGCGGGTIDFKHRGEYLVEAYK